MFHACVQRFDGMYKKFLGGKLNRALVYPENQKNFKILRHIESCGKYMRH